MKVGLNRHEDEHRVAMVRQLVGDDSYLVCYDSSLQSFLVLLLYSPHCLQLCLSRFSSSMLDTILLTEE